MTPADPREANLPVWARAYISTLRRGLEDAEIARNEARLATSPATSDTILDAYDDIPIGLGRGPIVRFRLGDERRMEWADVSVIHIHDGRTLLQVMAGSTVRIEPRAANVIHVAVVQ